jgi:hypothetical protein
MIYSLTTLLAHATPIHHYDAPFARLKAYYSGEKDQRHEMMDQNFAGLALCQLKKFDRNEDSCQKDNQM